MTRAVPLRSEQPPDDAVVVLRAGVMAMEVVRRSAERTFDVYSVYGISVEGVIDQTVLEACRGERVAGYRQIRLSTFGRCGAQASHCSPRSIVRTSRSCCPTSAR